jgi:hypothetical protein
MAGGHARLGGVEVRVVQGEPVLRLDVDHRELVTKPGGAERALQQPFKAPVSGLMGVRRSFGHWRIPSVCASEFSRLTMVSSSAMWYQP